MDRQNDFIKYRQQYPNFIYKKYSFIELEDRLQLLFFYEIENLTSFVHKIEVLKEDFKYDLSNTSLINSLVFNIGLLELVSYFKATLSKNIIIECGNINEEQESFFKKIYYYGLGEMLYTNKINVNINDFVEIKCLGEKINFGESTKKLNGYLIPIGGGKDSCVTLDLLGNNDNYAVIVNPKQVTLDCANIAGIKTVKVNRIIDKNLLDLNNKGYLNGHTPFSAMLAFLTTFISYITGKKSIALSNESSANESNVRGTMVNHQYSKTLEFENDFREYEKKYLKTNTNYFSFLRPILEVQIGYLFSKLDKYHNVFKSCNVGSKEIPWKWCCHCSKCLFVYIILSPFLYKEKLLDIFGEDLYENKELLNTFIELLGYGDNKPFDCVGTYEEVNYAISKTIKNINGDLPYLLQYFKDNYQSYDNELLNYFNNDNNLSLDELDLLKGVLYDK